MVDDNIMQEAIEVLLKIERRLESLEKDSSIIDVNIRTIDSKRIESYSGLRSDLTNVRETLEATKNNLRKCLDMMTSIAQEMKESLKTDQLKQLEQKSDELLFHQYLTHGNLRAGAYEDHNR